MAQIAEASDVSESTFFRYFSSKEAVALWDDLDPLLIEAIRGQPPESKPIPALRAAFRSVFSRLSPVELTAMRERGALIMSVPELRAATLTHSAAGLQMVAQAVAERAGRRPDELEVRILVGAVIGAVAAATLGAIQDPEADIGGLLDQALTHLEAGLPL